ncbi:hypothetical protein SUDANB58_05462 [Streptomyces sp. enrichment culture]|uniref:hypothetical protein n=1 Tax=Streptomyces sp. enrichment culture TaxID=1795815 RepID=UPI003F57FB43
MSHEEDHGRKEPRTALEEVLREVEDAETRSPESEGERRHRGEAGDTVTPNVQAQEQARGD